MATFPEEVLLFDRPSTEVCYDKIQYVDYRSATQLPNAGSLNFVIPPTANQYINLKKTYLKVKLRIVKSDGSAVPGNILVSCINLPLHSIFNQVDVLLHEQLVSSTGGQAYAYKSLFETMLEYGSAAKQSQLQAQGFYMDNRYDLDVSKEADVTKEIPKMRGQDWGYVTRWQLNSSKEQRRVLLDTVTNDQLRALTEVTHNILQGNIPLTTSHKRRLRTEKTFLQILGDIKAPLVKKREALCRKGDIIVYLLKAAAPRLKLFL